LQSIACNSFSFLPEKLGILMRKPALLMHGML